MERVIVIGCPGGGKSTFSRELRARTGLPLFHLDRMNWNAEGTNVPKPLFRARLAEALAGPRWIIDGNYMGTMEERLRACDTVFFLDYPTELCLKGVRARRGQARSDMPWVEEGEDAAFLRFIEGFNRESRPRILALLERCPEKELHIFRGRGEASAFLAGLRGQAAGVAREGGEPRP